MESTELLSKLEAQIEAYQSQRGGWPEECGRVSYGTAGFRGLASQIEHIFFNVGLIAGLKCLVSRANVAIMITASHNPVQDNGVKLIDGNGQMLDPEWEQIVENFCNTHQKDQIIDLLAGLLTKFDYKPDETQEGQYKVLIGMDTRPSSEALVGLVKLGLKAWHSIKYTDYGLLTTPALHFLVAESNKRGELLPEVYYEQLIAGVVDIFGQKDNRLSYSAEELIVDCANGVGTETMQYLLSDSRFIECLPIQLINTGDDGILNKLCGADHVKTTKLAPTNAQSSISRRRFASLDGDADRVVYFYILESGQLRLLDGDKIMALFVFYLKELLDKYHLVGQLTLGCVQTAYANGASTDYLERLLQSPVDCADTGVKNLHKKALDYDLGVYFEANGHGTIWISPKARQIVEAQPDKYIDFRKLFKIINNYTGDAVSDILVAETILKHYNWDIRKWDCLYEDRPNVLMKVEIPNRNVLETTNAGRTCLKPDGIQEMIDQEVSKYGLGARSFVRPSGTENVVRVYAEASGQDLANKLGEAVSEIVRQFCG